MTMIDGKVEFCAEEDLCPMNDNSASAPKATVESGGSQDGLGVKGESFSASNSLKDNPPEYAFDGDLETISSAGGHPKQWLQVDFGSPHHIFPKFN